MEFFLKGFTKFSEFSDKNVYHYMDSNLPPLVEETRMLPQHNKTYICKKEDL